MGLEVRLRVVCRNVAPPVLAADQVVTQIRHMVAAHEAGSPALLAPALFASSGPAQHANSRQPALGINNA